MNSRAVLLLPEEAGDASTLSLHDTHAQPKQSRTPLTLWVREVPTNSVLTDEAREAAIKLAGERVEHLMSVWAAEGCFDAHAAAQVAQDRMYELIAGRSAEQIVRMERDQAERMAMEPGATRA
jgi:hypothetical protein